MSAYEEEPKELNPSVPRAPELGKLEAALAELAPRAVSLDRDRLMYLAGQASVGAGRSGIRESSGLNPIRSGIRENSEINDVRSGIRENSELTQPARSNVSRSRPQAPAPRGWRWPAAFSGMSALAATLLVMLISRPPRVVERVVRVPMPAATVSDSQPPAPSSATATPTSRLPPAGQYVARELPRRAIDADRQHSPPAYLDLRDRVLAMGIETWTSPANEGGVKSGPPETYRELLNDALRGG